MALPGKPPLSAWRAAHTQQHISLIRLPPQNGCSSIPVDGRASLLQAKRFDVMSHYRWHTLSNFPIGSESRQSAHKLMSRMMHWIKAFNAYRRMIYIGDIHVAYRVPFCTACGVRKRVCTLKCGWRGPLDVHLTALHKTLSSVEATCFFPFHSEWRMLANRRKFDYHCQLILLTELRIAFRWIFNIARPPRWPAAVGSIQRQPSLVELLNSHSSKSIRERSRFRFL